MAMAGWIKLHRGLADHAIAGDPQAFSVWVHLLLMANHRETKRMMNGQILLLAPGQLITSRRSISEKTGVQESKVERILKLLKTEQQIEQVGTAKYRVISIVNWHLYQSDEQQDEQQENINGNEFVARVKPVEKSNSRRTAGSHGSLGLQRDLIQEVNSRRTADEQQMNTPGEVIPNGITQEGKEKNKSSRDQQADHVPYAEIFQAYADELPSLPQMKIKDDARKAAIRSIWRKDPRFQTVDFWQRYFRYVRGVEFLVGMRGIGFDWLVKPANFKKVLEGNYKDA